MAEPDGLGGSSRNCNMMFCMNACMNALSSSFSFVAVGTLNANVKDDVLFDFDV